MRTHAVIEQQTLVDGHSLPDRREEEEHVEGKADKRSAVQWRAFTMAQDVPHRAASTRTATPVAVAGVHLVVVSIIWALSSSPNDFAGNKEKNKKRWPKKR